MSTSACHPRVGSRSAWGRIMELSREMLGCAKRTDWDGVACLQQRRADLIHQVFATARAGVDLERLRSMALDLLDVDAEVTSLVERARDEIGEELRRLHQGKAARKAYGRR